MKNNILRFICFVITFIALPINALALTKTETVYVTLENNGNVKKSSINTKISNLNKGEVIDYTNLDNIKNVNGNEKFTYTSGKITWQSTGKDIYYKGTLSDNLPITIKTNYYLNDNLVNPKQIKGKKGNIKIVYKFINNRYDYELGLYTPFVVASTINIPEKNNSNVEVSNGKVISTGNKNIVLGLASPGLYDNFKIEELRQLDELTITYKTEKFKSSEAYFVITPKLLDDVDISKFDRFNTLQDNINALQSGMDQLDSGSKSLVEGVKELSSGNDSLSAGIKKALEGSQNLTNGLNQVNAGTNSLSSMNTLVDSLYENYQKNNELINVISSGYAKAQYEEGINRGNATKTELEAQLSQVNAGIKQLELLPELSDEQKAQLNTLQANKAQLEAGIKQCSEAIAQAEQDLANLPTNEAKLVGANEVIKEVLMGILGVDNQDQINEENINTFKTRINTLIGGINELTNGSNDLTNGLNEIYNGSNKLKDGSNKLKDGSNELSNGITKINNEGIKKLSSYSSIIKNYTYKAKSLINLSKNYHGYASHNADNTLFIYKMSK